MTRKIIIGLSIFFLFLTPVQAEEKVYTEEEIEAIEIAGTYPVELYTLDQNGKEVPIIVMVTVVFDKTILNSIANEGIDAKDFEILSSEFAELTEMDFVRLAHAHAWSLETGESIPIASITLEKISEDKYIVTFSTEKNTRISVNLFLKDSVVLDMSNAVSMNNIGSSAMQSKLFNHIRFEILFLIVVPLISLGIIYSIAWRRNKNINQLLYK